MVANLQVGFVENRKAIKAELVRLKKVKNMVNKKLKLTDERSCFRPFSYPWAFDAWLKHEQAHWLFSEVPMAEDVKDWKKKLSPSEKNFLTNIFRFFTQGDIDVAGGYVKNYLPYFRQPEVRMMLLGFAAREALHIAAYSHLIETLGLPETVYNQFLEYQEMKDKHDYVLDISSKNGDAASTATHIAVFSAFTEGMQLFSSFIMLLNFPRHGLMKGMGQIVTWSIVDEAVIEGTEVLTERGWVNIENISLSDKIYQYDMSNKETSFVFPTKVQQVQREQSFIFESEHIHQHVSPNHRMIIMNDDGTVGEIKAIDCPDNATLIVSGNKTGDDELTAEDYSAVNLIVSLIVSGELSVDWLYEKIPHVSSIWAESAVNYYLELAPTNKTVREAFKTLANIAGGSIVDNKFIKTEVSVVSKKELNHETKNFYCVAVPGKSFFIRSNDKISVTGNTMHTESMLQLFKTYIKENPEIWNDELKGRIYTIAEKMVELEEKFIDLAFAQGEMCDLNKEDVKQYIRYIADRRLITMGLKGIFKVKKNPLPWVESMINAPIHGNFFEGRVTDYAKGAITGTWDDVWGKAN